MLCSININSLITKNAFFYYQAAFKLEADVDLIISKLLSPVDYICLRALEAVVSWPHPKFYPVLLELFTRNSSVFLVDCGSIFLQKKMHNTFIKILRLIG